MCCIVTPEIVNKNIFKIMTLSNNLILIWRVNLRDIELYALEMISEKHGIL